MGFIQRTLEKVFKEIPEPKIEPTNINVVVQGGAMTIGENQIELVCFEAGANLKGFLAHDFDNGPLAFLKSGKYSAYRITIAPVEYGSSEYKVKKFNGVWEQGNLICDEFFDTIKEGTVEGSISQSSIFQEVSPGASVSGILNTSNMFSLKDEIAFIEGTFKAKNIGSFPASRVLDMLNRHMNLPVFGVPMSGIKKLDSTSADLRLSLLSLNSGQYVTFKDVDGRLFCFRVQESYKSSGKSITLKELTHDGNEVTLTWNHFRVSTTPDFNQRDFEARSSIRIGVEMRIPKLFENNIINDIAEIVISNDKPELPAFKAVDKESGFVPQKIKF